jgi:gamma-glutamylputrescine oxidase
MLPLSWWEKDFYFKGLDVIIIGSGIVGLSTAIELKAAKPNLKILVLDRGILPLGASTKNAGFACFGEVGELSAIEQQYGKVALLEITRQKIEGLKLLLQRCRNQIDYIQSKGYEVFLNPDEHAEILSAMGRYNALFLDEGLFDAPVYSDASHKIQHFGLNASLLIQNQYEGELHPVKMIHHLMQIALSMGILHLSGIEVEHIEKGKIHCKGLSIETNKVVLATNAFTKSLKPNANIKPGRGQVLITKEIPDLKLEGTFHYNKGYTYFRKLGKRLLIGGGRDIAMQVEETVAFEQTSLIQDYLKGIISTMILPGRQVEVEHTWSGIMGFGDELFPRIQKEEDHVYSAYRMNGMGVALGSYVGKSCAELVAKDL